MAFDRSVTYVRRAGWETSHIAVDTNREQSQFHSSSELEQVKGQQDNHMTFGGHKVYLWPEYHHCEGANDATRDRHK